MGNNQAEIPPKRRRWTFWRLALMAFIWSWVILLIGVIAAGAMAFMVYDYVTSPGQPGAAVEINIPEGATGRQIGEILAENKLIEHEGFFRLAMQIEGIEPNIRHGAYELHKGLSAVQLLHLLMEGPTASLEANQVRVTIPEGLSIPQAAALVDDPMAFIEAPATGLIARVGIEAFAGRLSHAQYLFFDASPSRMLVNAWQFERNGRY